MTSRGDPAKTDPVPRSVLPTARDAVAGERRPTPARSLGEAEPSGVSGEPEVEEVTFEADGSEWVARVIGRGGAVAPLLLLGFWPRDEADGQPVLEAFRAGRSLGHLDPCALAATLALASPRAVERRQNPARESGGRRARRSGGKAGGRRGIGAPGGEEQ